MGMGAVLSTGDCKYDVQQSVRLRARSGNHASYEEAAAPHRAARQQFPVQLIQARFQRRYKMRRRLSTI